MRKCEFCQHVTHTKVDEFTDPVCTETRRWYKPVRIKEPLDKERADEYHLFERRYEPKLDDEEPIWFISASGRNLLPVYFCPMCGREFET